MISLLVMVRLGRLSHIVLASLWNHTILWVKFIRADHVVGEFYVSGRIRYGSLISSVDQTSKAPFLLLHHPLIAFFARLGRDVWETRVAACFLHPLTGTLLPKAFRHLLCRDHLINLV